MRLAWIGTVVLGLGTASAAQAQPGVAGSPGSYSPSPYAAVPMLNPSNIMPNIYNPRTQPLSPYLNLFNGTGDPAVNYYYGVRPGTVGRAGSINGAPNIVASGGNRPVFFPQLTTAPDPFSSPLSGTGALSGDDTGAVLGPAGHPVVYGNTLGYFPGPGGGQNTRPGLSGFGNSRPAGRK
jgi:hypothetical protein